MDSSWYNTLDSSPDGDALDQYLAEARAHGRYGNLEYEADAYGGLYAEHHYDDYGHHRVKGMVGAGARSRYELGDRNGPLRVGGRASVFAGAEGEGMAGPLGQKGEAFAGARAAAGAHVGRALHYEAEAKAGAWAKGQQGVVRDPKNRQIHVGFGGDAGAGAKAGVRGQVGDQQHVGVKPNVGSVHAKFEPKMTIDEDNECLRGNIGVGAGLGVGFDGDIQLTAHNPVGKKTREYLDKGDVRGVARVVNPLAMGNRVIMGEPKNHAEEVVQHIPVAGQIMALGRGIGWW